jgi:hypothetical protein
MARFPGDEQAVLNCCRRCRVIRLLGLVKPPDGGGFSRWNAMLLKSVIEKYLF